MSESTCPSRRRKRAAFYRIDLSREGRGHRPQPAALPGSNGPAYLDRLAGCVTLLGQVNSILLAERIRRVIEEGRRNAALRARPTGRLPLHFEALCQFGTWLRGQPMEYWLEHADWESWRDHFRAWRAELPGDRRAALAAEAQAEAAVQGRI